MQCIHGILRRPHNKDKLENMKAIAKYSSGLEAQFASNFLNSRGLNTHVRGAKDYLAFYLGGDKGNYEVLVQESEAENAQMHLRSLDMTKETSLTEGSTKAYLKRSIMFSFFSIFILPLIFNVVAINNLISYVRLERNSIRKAIAVAAISVLQFFAIGTVYFIFFYKK